MSALDSVRPTGGDPSLSGIESLLAAIILFVCARNPPRLPPRKLVPRLSFLLLSLELGEFDSLMSEELALVAGDLSPGRHFSIFPIR